MSTLRFLLTAAFVSACSGANAEVPSSAHQEAEVRTPSASIAPLAPSATELETPPTGPSLPEGKPSLEIPLHTSDAVLRVYGVPTRGEDGRADINGVEITLFKYEPKNGKGTFLGRVRPQTSSNASGIFAPRGVTKDDTQIVFEALMGPPGAGGGHVAWGWGMLPLKAGLDLGDGGKDQPKFICSELCFFFDDGSKVIYTGEGDNTPHNPQPGPSNEAAIYFRDLSKPDEVKTLLAEPDTTYQIIVIGKAERIFKYRAIKYTFSAQCPRSQGPRLCADKKITDGTIHVP